ncbi:hypothetical protein GQ43DRAFT_429160 [Delitschia confertaspora ATCC 74209]|uniref:Glycosyl transferase CAP10 domain-containing protein n=1 Tax=Delitschia confertaspora ATCC 74209 TaxID=1513339 RepID=A0A9P4JS99_9PLEO|nr:hypothetical protein GQ43DRAFT_429160 [Delitschia confertaspora ATCC 74209]
MPPDISRIQSKRFFKLLILTSFFCIILFLYGPTTSSRRASGVPVSIHLPTPGTTTLEPLKLEPSRGSTDPAGSANHPELVDDAESAEGQHPIDRLIEVAEQQFVKLRNSHPASLQEAAQAYRNKRNRHPPPGFDKWYNYATSTGCLIPESFFDSIYQDLQPFWGVPPYELRRLAKGYMPRMGIRNGTVSVVLKEPKRVQSNDTENTRRLDAWVEMVKGVVRAAGGQEMGETKGGIPDVDIPINLNTEPVLILPFAEIQDLLSNTRKFMPRAAEVVDHYSSLEDVDTLVNHTFDPKFLGPRGPFPAYTLGPRPYWELVRPACPSSSATGLNPLFHDIWLPKPLPEHSPALMLPTDFPQGSLNGYVRYWTTATHPCNFPHLQGLHGAFVKPRRMRAFAEKLFPLFSEAKLAVNNDILLPSAEEWNLTLRRNKHGSNHKSLPWAQKRDKLYWRGPASGGHSTKTNWHRLQRHRFVSMLNASHVAKAQMALSSNNRASRGAGPAKNFKLSERNIYGLQNMGLRVDGQGMEKAKGMRSGLAEWVKSWADVKFTEWMCDDEGLAVSNSNSTTSLSNSTPSRALQARSCPYLEPFFSLASPSAQNQFDQYKYIPILDGDTAGEDGFLSVLRSSSVPVRASVHKRWFDARLISWKHFVPMDNTFVDLYGILEFFVGPGIPQHQNPKREGGLDDRNASEGSNIIGRSKTEKGHDKEAEIIANAGKAWAGKVLRKEDMVLTLNITGVYISLLTIDPLICLITLHIR